MFVDCLYADKLDNIKPLVKCSCPVTVFYPCLMQAKHPLNSSIGTLFGMIRVLYNKGFTAEINQYITANIRLR